MYCADIFSLVDLRNHASEEGGGGSLVTTELFGVRALIVFIMVMTTFYAYVIIIHTVTSHEHCNVRNTVYKTQLFCCCFYPAECAACRTETEAFWKQILFLNPVGSHTKTSLSENKEYIASFCSSFRISLIFRA